MAEIALRGWTAADVPALAAIMNNERMQGNLRDGIPFPYTETDAVAFLQMIWDAVPGARYDFAITYDGEVVGNICAIPKDNVYRLTAEIGYCLAEAYWGRGIMVEAVRQVCAYMFARTEIIRISAEVFAPNAASCRVLEKAGFQLEGILRQNVLKNGQVLDAKMYAILKREYTETGG